ncbi:MAG TPA: phosphotransferase [Caulobacteraceae bacterium]
MSGEEALSGGRMTVGVVRVGDTVRRPPNPNSEFVRGLLRHLEAVGFDDAPRHIGVDEKGREVFAFLPGTAPEELTQHGDGVLRAAASLIRRYHDATAPMFASSEARNVGFEVACHNDLSPCNAIFKEGLPVALIDFDAASPGTRSYDLGYAAWLWLNIGASNFDPAEQIRRLRLFLEAYGPVPNETEVVAQMILRQTIVEAEGARIGDSPMANWAKACRRWTQEHLLSRVRG